MVKRLVGILAVTLVLSASSMSVLAAGPGRGCNYVDADGDGICDNYGRGRNFVDAEGQIGFWSSCMR